MDKNLHKSNNNNPFEPNNHQPPLAPPLEEKETHPQPLPIRRGVICNGVVLKARTFL